MFEHYCGGFFWKPKFPRIHVWSLAKHYKIISGRFINSSYHDYYSKGKQYVNLEKGTVRVALATHAKYCSVKRGSKKGSVAVGIGEW